MPAALPMGTILPRSSSGNSPMASALSRVDGAAKSAGQVALVDLRNAHFAHEQLNARGDGALGELHFAYILLREINAGRQVRVCFQAARFVDDFRGYQLRDSVDQAAAA